MRLFELIRYAFSDLRHRKATTLLNIGAVCLAAMYILVLGFYGASIHAYQQDVLARSMRTRIVVAVPDGTDESLLFSEERLAELSELPGVVHVTPRVELNVRVLLRPDRVENTRALGTAMGDPALGTERMVWGGGVSGPAEREVVLPLRFFESLGGVLNNGPQPPALVLEVSRTTAAGEEQHESLKLGIVGLLADGEEERVHVPVELVRELNLYCGSYKASLFGDDRHEVRWPSFDAFSRPEHEPLVAEEAALQQVAAEALQTTEVLESAGPVWARIEDAADVSPAQVGVIAGRVGLALGKPVLRLDLEGARTLKLGAEDPRWADLGLAGDDGGGRVAALTPVGRRVLAGRSVLASARPTQAAVGAVDIVADPVALTRLVFDPRTSDGIEPWCLVTSTGPAGNRVLASLDGQPSGARDEVAWAVLVPPEGSIGLVGTHSEAGPEDLHTAPFTSGDLFGVGEGWRLRYVPAAFVHHLAGTLGPTVLPPRAAVITSGHSAMTTRRLERAAAGEHFVVAALSVPGAVTSLWSSVPPPPSPSPGPGPGPGTGPSPAAGDDALTDSAADVADSLAPGGVVIWGGWADVVTRVASLEDAGWTRLADEGQLADAGAALVPGTEVAVIEALGAGAAACRVVPFSGVRARVAGRPDLPLIVASQLDLPDVSGAGVRWRGAPAGHWSGVAPDESVQLQGATWTLPALWPSEEQALPERLVLVSEGAFRDAAFGSASHHVAPTGQAGLDLLFTDALAWRDASVRAEQGGLVLEALVPVERVVLQRWRMTDPLADDGRLERGLVRQVGMASPPFRDCQPRLELPVSVDGLSQPVSLGVSGPRDPLRFAHYLAAGSWLRADRGASQIVVPGSWLAAELRPTDHLGQGLSVRVTRQLPNGPDEELVLPLEVVGVTDADIAFVPEALVADVSLWMADRVLYDESTGLFRSAAEIVSGHGDLRCNVYAASLEDVEPLVAALRARGYETHDKLAEQRALRRLGRVLSFLVIFFALGCAANAAITVCVATLMSVRSKIYEIGILRAHGLRRAQILGLFASQGAVIGLSAFALAAGVVLLVEPFIRRAVVDMFSLDAAAVLAGSPFSVRWWWVPVSAFAAAVAFSLVGVLLPAWHACRLSPVEALRARE